MKKTDIVYISLVIVVLLWHLIPSIVNESAPLFKLILLVYSFGSLIFLGSKKAITLEKVKVLEKRDGEWSNEFYISLAYNDIDFGEHQVPYEVYNKYNVGDTIESFNVEYFRSDLDYERYENFHKIVEIK